MKAQTKPKAKMKKAASKDTKMTNAMQKQWKSRPENKPKAAAKKPTKKY